MNSPALLAQYKYIFFAFAGLVSIGPLAMDTYLPAFPTLAKYYSTDIATIQFTVVCFMFGNTLGQFLAGPLSDVIGRAWIGLAGSLLFSLTSLAIVISSDISLMLAARTLQGFAAGSASVIVSAMITENYRGKDAARVMTSVTLVIMGVPLIAPLIGALLLKTYHWQAVFYFLALFGLTVSLITFFNIPTQRLRPKSKRNNNIYSGLTEMFRNYRAVLSKPAGRIYLVAMGTNISVYMVFATSASFAYMEFFDASLELFPFLLGANTISLIAGNRISVFLLRYYEPYQVCTIGSSAMLICCVVLFATIIFFEPSLYLVVGLIILTAGTIPISGPIASVVFMELYDKNAGTASASMGVARVLFGMVGGFVVTILHDGTLYPMASIMLVIALIACLCFRLGGRHIQGCEKTT